MNLSNKSLLHRLESIIFDAEYVSRCASYLQLPVVANQRCGSWYVPLDLLAEACYFKSTDGHINKWAFSHRRLNLHLLPLIEAKGGCIIVDSTRGSKRFSDALSKTIPIWCAVLNRLLFPNDAESREIVLPNTNTVSVQEAEDIRQVLPSLRDDAGRLGLDIRFLRSQLSRPLKPYFLEPPSIAFASADTETSTAFAPNEPDNLLTHHIYVVMASTNETSLGLPFLGYIRGAGDDEDNWAYGMTAAQFWQGRNALLEALKDSEMDFPSIIYQSTSHRQPIEYTQPVQIGSTGIYVGVAGSHVTLKILQHYDPYDAIIVCNQMPNLSDIVASLAKKGIKPYILQLDLVLGKLGSRGLRTILPKLVAFVTGIKGVSPRILVADDAGKDHAVGVALALDCLFYDQDRFSNVPTKQIFDKEMIRKRLAMIVACKSDINPSRTTLQSVHAILMPWNDIERRIRVDNGVATQNTLH